MRPEAARMRGPRANLSFWSEEHPDVTYDNKGRSRSSIKGGNKTQTIKVKCIHYCWWGARRRGVSRKPSAAGSHFLGVNEKMSCNLIGASLMGRTPPPHTHPHNPLGGGVGAWRCLDTLYQV